MNRWKPERRQPLRHFTQQFHAEAAEIHARSKNYPGDHHKQRDRFVFQKSFTEQQYHQCGEAQQKRRRVRFSQMRKEVTRTFPEVPMRSLKPKELGQLCTGYEQSDTALKADKDAFGNEV